MLQKLFLQHAFFFCITKKLNLDFVILTNIWMEFKGFESRMFKNEGQGKNPIDKQITL